MIHRGLLGRGVAWNLQRDNALGIMPHRLRDDGSAPASMVNYSETVFFENLSLISVIARSMRKTIELKRFLGLYIEMSLV